MPTEFGNNELTKMVNLCQIKAIQTELLKRGEIMIPTKPKGSYRCGMRFTTIDTGADDMLST